MAESNKLILLTTMRQYHFDLLPDELKPTVKKTPPVNFRNVRRARFGIAMMHLFTPRADTKGVRVSNIRIPRPDGGKQLRLRIYEPKLKDSSDRIGMVFMHWGGFVVGNLKTEHHRCVRLCRSENMVIVSVKYRLAPEHPFPAGLDDAETALRWLHENSEKFGLTSKRIGVGGTSAGGGLAAALALRCLRNREDIVGYQYLGFPVLDSRCKTASANFHIDTPNWTSEANHLMWEYYLQDQVPNEIASPALADDLSGLPPTLLWTAEFDPLHDEAVQYYEQLKRDNIPVVFHDYDNCVHGFDSILNPTGVIKESHEDQSKFFKLFRDWVSTESNGW
ncbi:MAG: alpha/beta hydrolase [Bacteroidota bacterium]